MSLNARSLCEYRTSFPTWPRLPSGAIFLWERITFLWRISANLWLKIAGWQEDRCPTRRVVCRSIVLPFRLGPAPWRGHFFVCQTWSLPADGGREGLLKRKRHRRERRG
jgi:hypothetical protein